VRFVGVDNTFGVREAVDYLNLDRPCPSDSLPRKADNKYRGTVEGIEGVAGDRLPASHDLDFR